MGMIKQSVLKQVKRGKGVGKAKFYIGEGRYNNHCKCNNRIVLSFLRDIF